MYHKVHCWVCIVGIAIPNLKPAEPSQVHIWWVMDAVGRIMGSLKFIKWEYSGNIAKQRIQWSDMIYHVTLNATWSVDVLNKEHHGMRHDIPHDLLSCCHGGLNIRMSSEFGDDPAFLKCSWRKEMSGVEMWWNIMICDSKFLNY
jgi:hypothetical protein